MSITKSLLVKLGFHESVTVKDIITELGFTNSLRVTYVYSFMLLLLCLVFTTSSSVASSPIKIKSPQEQVTTINIADLNTIIEQQKVALDKQNLLLIEMGKANATLLDELNSHAAVIAKLKQEQGLLIAKTGTLERQLAESNVKATQMNKLVDSVFN